MARLGAALLCAAGLALAVPYGVGGLAALAATWHACPGHDCGDAVGVSVLGAVLVPLGLAAAVLGWRRLASGRWF